MKCLNQWRIYAEKALKLNIYINYKNLISFTIIKVLNQKQVKWLKLLKQYKFKISYTSEKDNSKVNALNWQSDYMKIKEIFNRNILKINNDNILFANFKHKLNTTLQILKNKEKQFLIKKEKYLIMNNKINKCIWNYHNNSVQEYSEVIKTLQLM